MARVSFLGLGVMGAPMAGHLAKAGHKVTVWNRTQSKAEIWVKKYGNKKASVASDPAQAIWGSEFVFTCLGDDPDVLSIYDELAPGMGGGMVVVDHTTASAKLARQLDELALEKGALFVDAPVSGGQAGAENGQLTIMCGGRDEAFKKAKPIMDAYSKQTTHIGGPGTGQLAKSVNQICIAGVLQGLSEGLAFAIQNDLDTDKVLEAVSKGAAQSWQMDNRAKTMVNGEFDFGFAVEWMRKDLRIALEAGRESGSSLPLTALIDQFYADVQNDGGSRWDTSSLITRLVKDRAGDGRKQNEGDC